MAAVVSRKFGEDTLQFLGKKVYIETSDQKVCNANDAVGTISDAYSTSTLGVGVHSTLSTPAIDSSRDFVLT